MSNNTNKLTVIQLAIKNGFIVFQTYRLRFKYLNIEEARNFWNK